MRHVTFGLGRANANSAVQTLGQTLPLPPGQYSTLAFLGTGVNGDQLGRLISESAPVSRPHGVAVISKLGWPDGLTGPSAEPWAELEEVPALLNEGSRRLAGTYRPR